MTVELQQGQRWRYDDGVEPREYWITFLGHDVIHLTDVKSGRIESPYPRAVFEAGIKTRHWEYISYSEDICNRCQENVKMPNDYLCEKCRYG